MKKADTKTTRIIKIVIVLAACLIYGVTPTDIIPDLIPLFGFVDDAALLIGSAAYIISTIRNKREGKPTDDNEKG